MGRSTHRGPGTSVRVTGTLRVTAIALAAIGAAACSQETPVNRPTPESQTEAAAPSPRRSTVPGEFLVKFKGSTNKAVVANAFAKASLQSARAYQSVPGLHLVRVSPGSEAQHAKTFLEQHGEVEYVEPNFIVRAFVLPDDPRFDRLWGLHNIGQITGNPDADIDAPEAWDLTTGSSDVVIAVIDSGVDYRHEDLAANVFRNTAECTADGIDSDANGYIDDCYGIDPANGDADPMDDVGHGTHVSGTIGAVGNNGIGVAGVAWNVRILPCKFLNAQGNGTTADAIACLDYIAALRDRGINLVASNNSWGGADHSRALDDAITAQRQRGILLIAAAGNERLNVDVLPHYPCAVDRSNVICVAASSFGDYSPTFTNYGVSTVHLSAPGEGTLSTMPNSTYDYADGTSMATPHVSGTVALLAAQDPARDWRTLKNLVLAGADVPMQVEQPTITGRRLNAVRAMTCTNAVLLKRLRPLVHADLLRAIGDAVPLRALHINCGAPNGDVTVSVAPSGELVTLRDNGLGNDEVAGDGLYSGSWTGQAAGTYTLTFPGTPDNVATVQIDAHLKRGFPTQTRTLNDFDILYSGLGNNTLVGNIDADPELEILVPSIMLGPLYAWNHDGSEVPGWPLYDVFYVGHATLGEFDGDPRAAEIAVMFAFGGPRLFSGSGSGFSGWPRLSTVDLPPAAVDLDGDGRDEVIGRPARYADGSLVNSGMEIPDAPSGADGWGTTAVADLDADGQPDFIIVGGSAIYASNVWGPLAGFPVPAPQPNISGGLHPVIGDVDADGKPEIVIAWTESVPNVGLLTHVRNYSNRGVLEREAIVPASATLPVLADMDADGIPEIIVATSAAVHVWKGDGTILPGWPVSLGIETWIGAVTPVVGDVTGDGLPDVVMLNGNFDRFGLGRIQIFNRDGTSVASFPKDILSTIGGMTPAIADIDRDGRNDVVVATAPDIGLRDGVFAYDLRGVGPYGPIEWGQYMEGPAHRGYYELGKNLPNHAFLVTQAHGQGTVSAANGTINCGTDCIERLTKGSTVVLTATAGSGASFDRWLGACAGQGNPCTVSVQRFTSVAADFDSPLSVSLTGTGAGTVISSPAGISCPSDCDEVYDARTVVTLTAAPAADSGFDGWSGACRGVATTCRVTIDAAKSVGALFVRERRLTVAKSGAGTGAVRSVPTGIDCGTSCAGDFAPNSVVTLNASPAVDSYFQSWVEPCPSFLSNPCTVTMDAPKTVTARFGLKSLLTVTRTGNGRVTSTKGIDCGADCSEYLEPSEFLVLTAEPAFDSVFVGWSGACASTGTQTNCGLFMEVSKAVTATFALKPTLTVTFSGSGTGQVVSVPNGIACQSNCSAPFAQGTPVTLTATALGNATFAGWSGACAGADATCTLTVDASRTVNAAFAAPPPPSAGGSSGSSGGGSNDLLSLLALVAMLGGVRRWCHEARIRARSGAIEVHGGATTLDPREVPRPGTCQLSTFSIVALVLSGKLMINGLLPGSCSTPRRISR